MKRYSVFTKLASLTKAWRKRKAATNRPSFRPQLEGLERRDVPTNLSVTSFTPTATGFTATFNEEFNPTNINLYDTAGALGPDDVTLTAAGGPSTSYHGSLIIDPLDNTITFVKTDVATGSTFNPSTGVLAAGTYTATFRSASNGFTDMSGGCLNGTSGDNYVTTFVVTTPPVAIGLPDFAAGPGNTVNEPNTIVGLPVSVSNGSSATSGQFTLKFSPNLLDITSVTGNIQTLSVSGSPTSGTFTLSFDSATTSNITYSTVVATIQANIQSALDALSTIGPGNSYVVAASDTTFRVALTGALAAANQPAMTASGSGFLPSGSIAVTNNTLTGETFTLDSSSNLAGGIAVLDMSASTALSGSNVKMGVIIANVPDSASSLYLTQGLLHWSSTSLTSSSGSISVEGADAVQVVDYFGNVTGTGSYTSADTTLIGRVTVGTDNNVTTGTIGGFSAMPNTDPLIPGDLNRDGIVNVSDETVLNQLLAGDHPTPIQPLFPATHFSVSASSPVTAGTAYTVTVTALDEFNNVAILYSGTAHFTTSDVGSGVDLPSDYTFVAGSSGDSGIHTFSNGVTLSTAGAQTITATDTSSPGITGNGAFLVDGEVISGLRVSAPLAAVGGTYFTTTVTAVDTHGNVASGYTGTVHFSSSDGSATLPANYTFTSGSGDDNGVHVFTSSAKLVTSGNQTITATDTVTSSIKGSAVANVAGAASQLAISYSASPTSGTPFTITVTAEDSSTNVATAYQGTVSFATNDTAVGASVPANYTFTAADQGVHVFTDGVTLIASDYQTITATDLANNSITGSSAIFIPVTIWIPTNLTAALGGTVTVPIDVNGLLDTVNGNYGLSGGQFIVQYDTSVFTGPPTPLLGSIPGQGTLWGVSDANPSLGLFELTSNGSYQLTTTSGGSLALLDFTVKSNAPLGATPIYLMADDGGGPPATNLTDYNFNAYSLDPAPQDTANSTDGQVTIDPTDVATHLAVTTPSSVTAGSPSTFTVTAKDASNSTATSYTGTIHFGDSDGGPSSAVPGDYTFVAADDGVHTFTNGLTLVTAGSQSITATDMTMSGIRGSATLNVNPAAAATLAVNTPDIANSGISFTVTVTALDSYGNAATGYTGTVHFSSTDGSAELADQLHLCLRRSWSPHLH